MRRLQCVVPAAAVASGAVVYAQRFMVQYGSTMLSHAALKQKYAVASEKKETVGDVYASLLPALNQTEEYILSWNANRWMFRTPRLLEQHELDMCKSQLHTVRTQIVKLLATKKANRNHVKTICDVLNVSTADVERGTRAWIQEKINGLRWDGRAAEAKIVKDAWLALEESGNPDHNMLLRLCCLYAMGRLGTFEGAFGNTIVYDEGTGKHSLQTSNCFQDALRLTVTNFPTLDIAYDFLGMNPEGYRASLGRFVVSALAVNDTNAADHVRAPPPQRAPSDNSGPSTHILYHRRDAGDLSVLADVTTPTFEGLVHIATNPTDTVVTLIVISAANKWRRREQLPPQRQLDGIVRRTALVFGVDVDTVRYRTLVLPPRCVDTQSLKRLVGACGGVVSEESRFWVNTYSKELPPEDEGYDEAVAVEAEEEWMKL